MIKGYLKFLVKLFKHKYYVFKFGLKLKVPILNLIIHDWSKFMPDEHRFWFYRQIDTSITKYDYSLGKHHHRNKHHWQHWMIRFDGQLQQCLDMPDKYVKEMVADWAAAGYGKSGKLDILEWYEKNCNVILITNKTRYKAECLMTKLILSI